MAVSSFARETITRLRYPMRTDHGTEKPDYSAEPESELDIEGCWLEPITSTENNDNRQAVLTGYTVAAPPTADVRSTDLVRYETPTLFGVDGEPLPIKSPTGRLNQKTFVIRIWEG